MPLALSGTTDEVERMTLTKKVDAYVKRDSILDENIQKAYSLMLGQFTELLKSKLKTTTDWMTVSTDLDLLGLMKTIRSVIFKFEDQRYLPLSLQNAKSNLYYFCQNNLSNPEYLEKFTNLVDIAESFDGQLHDQALTNIAQGMWPDTKDVSWVGVPEPHKIELNEQAQEMYLACAFISQDDPKRYGRLKEELENDYTKGTDS